MQAGGTHHAELCEDKVVRVSVNAIVGFWAGLSTFSYSSIEKLSKSTNE